MRPLLYLLLLFTIALRCCHAFVVRSPRGRFSVNTPINHICDSSSCLLLTAASAPAETSLQGTTPLNLFREHQNQLIQQADESHDVRTCHDDTTADRQDTAINIIDWNDMLQMVIDDGDTVDGEAIQLKRQDFCRRIQNSGGWCVVRLDKVAATVVNDMWKCIETLFINQENDEHGLIRGFSLADASANSKLSNDKRQSGYLHVQTQLLHDHQLVPRGLETLIGPCGMGQATSAFQLMSQLCKTFTTVVNSGERCPRDAAVLRDRLLYEMDSTLYDEPWMSGTYHRLCQYVSGELQTEIDDDTSTGRRLLRSHCDWTIATALPVSAIPGLELYDPTAKRWIRIEQVLARMQHSNEKAANASEHNWNSQYAVVITGSWLELLTKGETKATVHRVVSDPTCRKQRMSAPFFMRPRESLFRQVDQEFNRAVVDDCDALDYRQAIHKMGDYLVQQ